MQDAFENRMDDLKRAYRGEWFDAKAAGLTFPNPDGSNRQEIARSLDEGDELQLSPEPENPYDRNAIALLAPDGRQVGYCETRLAAELVSRLRRGFQLRAFVRAVRERNGQCGLSFAILQYQKDQPSL